MVGTAEMEGEIRLLNRKEIRPGEKGVVFFKPDEPVYCLVGDHFVARLPTPMVTLGGGRILDHLVHFPRRRQASLYGYLERRLSGTVDDLVTSELQKVVIVASESLLSEANFSMSEVQKAESLTVACDHFTEAVAKYLENKPHLAGLSLKPLVKLSEYDEITTETFLEYLVAIGSMTKLEDKYNLAGRGMSLKGAVKDAHDGIMKILREQPYAPPTLSDLASAGKHYKEAIKYIIDSGEGYKCGPDFIFLSDVWQEIVRFIKMQLGKANTLAVAELRERFGFTRKFVIPILEETDRIRLTRREGDVRVKGDRFESEEFDI
jgi:selenocysteine-specific elongation factor